MAVLDVVRSLGAKRKNEKAVLQQQREKVADCFRKQVAAFVEGDEVDDSDVAAYLDRFDDPETAWETSVSNEKLRVQRDELQATLDAYVNEKEGIDREIMQLKRETRHEPPAAPLMSEKEKLRHTLDRKLGSNEATQGDFDAFREVEAEVNERFDRIRLIGQMSHRLSGQISKTRDAIDQLPSPKPIASRGSNFTSGA